MSKKRINYSIRLAKNAERKMICEAIRRLSVFDLLESYQYIGFGSYYFSDFYLFHKELNITSMHSIEKDVASKARYESNRPFECINLKFGESNNVLPNIEWSKKSVIWLDYDGDLNGNVLSDIKTATSYLNSGSMLIISVNADPGEVPSKKDGRLGQLRDLVGEEKIPGGVEEKDFVKWGKAGILRDIISNEIQETLVARNAGIIDIDQKMKYHQVFNFHYADDAKMLTTGGVIYQASDATLIDRCTFKQLSFTCDSANHYEIEVPYLTYREIRCIDQQLPDKSSIPNLEGVPSKDINIYSKMYRYLPNFAEIEA